MMTYRPSRPVNVSMTCPRDESSATMYRNMAANLHFCQSLEQSRIRCGSYDKKLRYRLVTNPKRLQTHMVRMNPSGTVLRSMGATTGKIIKGRAVQTA